MRAASSKRAGTANSCSAAASTPGSGRGNPAASWPGRRPSRRDLGRAAGVAAAPAPPHIRGSGSPRARHQAMQRQAFAKNVLERERTQDSLARLEALAQLMDGAFLIPGTSIRIGLDAVIGLVPIAGDLIASLVFSYLIWEARQLGASRWVIARMIANTAIDTVFGAVPIVGDAFDVLFRANLKNLALLRRHLERRGRLGGARVIEGEAVRLN